MNTVHYEACPICGSNRIDPLLTVKDESVSKQSFVIWQCRECSLRFTQDVPAEDAIGPYYQSPDYISHSNTSKGLLNSLYQRVRTFTLKQKSALIRKHTRNTGSLLDLGAGVGAFVNQMKQDGWSVTGLEPDPGARKNALDTFGIELWDTDQLQQLRPQSFDAITLWHVLEHVHALHEYVEQLKNLLRPGGRIFIAVPNYNAREAGAYGNFWAAYDVPRHLYHFSPKSIKTLMNMHGLQVETMKPMWFDSFYISLLSSKYRHGKSNWIGAGFQGLRSNLAAAGNVEKCSSVIYIIKASR